MAKQLILGTLFTGDIAPKFWSSIKKMKGGIKSLGSELRRLKRELRKAKQTINELNKPMNSKAPGKYAGMLKRVGSAFKTMLTYGGVGALLYGITAAFRAGVNEIVQYDQALKNLEAISGATSDELMIMGETIQEIAKTTKFSTAEIGGGMVLLSQAGFDATESVQAMGAVAALATGTLSTMSTVSDLLTTSVRAFGLSALESGRVADVMANAVNKSKLTIDKLRIAFNFAGAASSQAGLSIEQTAASMMVLANNGLRASTIGTGFRQVLKRLIAPNEKLKQAFVGAGVALESITISQTQNYEQVLLNLSRVLWDTKKNTVDMAKAFELFGLRGSQAAAILVKEFASRKFKEALNKTYEIGTAARMQAIQFKGLAVQIKNLKDQWGVLFVAIGESGLRDAMAMLVAGLRTVVSVLGKVVKNGFGSAIVQATLLSSALWLVIKAVTALYRGLVLLSGATVFKALFTGAGLASATGGAVFVAIAVAIGTLTTVVYSLISAYDRLAKKASQLAAKHSGVISSLDMYRGALERFDEQTKEGTLNQDEYGATLRRLIKDHPRLAKKVDITKDSLKKITKAVQDLADEEQVSKVAALTEEINNLGRASGRAAIFSGLLARYREFMNFIRPDKKKPNGIKDIIADLSELASSLGWSGGLIKYFFSNYTDALTDTNDEGERTLSWFQRFIQWLTRAGEEGDKSVFFAVKQKKAMGELAKELLDMSHGLNSFEIVAAYQHDNAIMMSAKNYANLIILINAARDAETKRNAEIEAQMAAIAARAKSTFPSNFGGYLKQADSTERADLIKLLKDRKLAIDKARDNEKFLDTEKGLRGVGLEVKIQRAILAVKQEYTLKGLKLIRGNDIESLKERLRSIKVELDKFNAQKPEDADAGVLGALKEKAVATKAEITALYQEFDKLLLKNSTLSESDLLFLNGLVNQSDKLNISIGKAEAKLEDFTKSFTELFEGVGENFIDNFANGLASIGSGAESLQDKFKNMAQSMMQDIIALLLKLAILKGMLKISGSTGFFHNIATAGLTKMGVLSATSSVAKVVSPISSSIQPSTLSNNLPVVSQQSFVNTNTGSSVGGSGGSVNVFKIDAVDAQSFVKMLSSREAQSVFVNSVMNNKGHNGVVRSAG